MEHQNNRPEVTRNQTANPQTEIPGGQNKKKDQSQEKRNRQERS